MVVINWCFNLKKNYLSYFWFLWIMWDLSLWDVIIVYSYIFKICLNIGENWYDKFIFFYSDGFWIV